MISTSFSPELRLTVACCRWPPSDARNEAITAAASPAIDWAKLIAAARRHRVEALVDDGLQQARVQPPEPAARELQRLSRQVATSSLRNGAEEGHLAQELEKAGIDALFVKGSTLAMLAYGSLVLKSGNDIDLLIAPHAIMPACELLARLGYERLLPVPELPQADFEIYIADRKETSWINRVRGTVVDLHVALTEYGSLLPKVGLGSPRQTVTVSRGVTLPTLARDELFAYLSVHGAQHHWRRLKWLADLAAYAGTDPEEIERLNRASIAHGAGRCAAVALALCHRLFETPAPSADRDRRVPRLAATALLAMSDFGGDPEFERRPRHAVELNLAHALMKPGIAHKLTAVRHLLFYPYFTRHLRLHRALRPLYTLLLLPGWWRRTRVGPSPPP